MKYREHVLLSDRTLQDRIDYVKNFAQGRVLCDQLMARQAALLYEQQVRQNLVLIWQTRMDKE